MFRNRIAELRDKHGKGISKAHLARQIGVCRSHITKLEEHQATPSAEVMFKIANYFGCPVEDAFKYVPGETRPNDQRRAS